MKKRLCALCLALLVPMAICAARFLPPDTRTLVAEKYAGWSGVLRLWVVEGWAEGSPGFPAWLNRCASRFEKRHPGVYVQPRFVDAGAVAAMNDSGIPRPDMLLVPPGLLSSPEGLLPLTAPESLRASLARCGAWGTAIYAVPVAMGGYLWAWNTGQLDALPNSWRDAGAVPAALPPETWLHWDAALLALCAGRYPDAQGETTGDGVPTLPGMDLGLAPVRTPAPTATPVPEEGVLLPCRLPDGFQFAADAWQQFINGEAAAMPVTQREVRRLQALSDRGRGPDWRLSPGAAAFTDQLLCLAIVDGPDRDEQAALCAEFLATLLDDDSQKTLCRAPAFGVTLAPSGYDAADPLSVVDDTLRAPGLRIPNCFDGKWPGACAGIVRKFIDGAGEAWQLWPLLADRLSENPNIQNGIQ